jgi:diacylglycerol kinase family enzyme
VHDVVVGNCQFFDGMKVSPRSYPGDGVMDVQVFRGPLSEAYAMLWQLARGDHVPGPTVVEVRAKGSLSVETEVPLLVEVDGQALGTTPARFELFPQVIQVKL